MITNSAAALLTAICLLPACLPWAGNARAAAICPALPSRASLPREARPEALDIPGWKDSANAIDASLARQDRGSFRLVFVGDSITASWDPPIFQKFFGPYSPLLLGISGDRTEGMLYRLSHSELSGQHPRVLVLLAGTNNTSGGSAPENTALGIAQIVRLVHARSPATKILVLGLLPRGIEASDPMRLANARVNAEIARCADNRVVFYYDAAPRLLDPAGRLTDQMSFDHLHLTPTGYYKLAEALEPEISRLMAN